MKNKYVIPATTVKEVNLVEIIALSANDKAADRDHGMLVKEWESDFEEEIHAFGTDIWSDEKRW